MQTFAILTFDEDWKPCEALKHLNELHASGAVARPV
jgi:hypothetical protein